MSDPNSGVGWYEVIHPQNATTEIVAVMEDGSIYCPEGVITPGEFAFAAVRGQAHRLVRADDLAAHDAEVRAAERERCELAAYEYVSYFLGEHRKGEANGARTVAEHIRALGEPDK